MSTSFGWEGNGRYGSWTRGVQVKLWDPLRTRAIPERLRGIFTTRRYTNPRLPLPYLYPQRMEPRCVFCRENPKFEIMLLHWTKFITNNIVSKHDGRLLRCMVTTESGISCRCFSTAFTCTVAARSKLQVKANCILISHGVKLARGI